MIEYNHVDSIRHLGQREGPKCRLLSGVFAVFIQTVLVGVCVLTLLIKRALERPQRDIVTWAFDFGKQGVGSAVSHFSNIVLSVYIAGTIRDSNECSWYLLSYVVDSTLGLGLNVGLLYIVEIVQQRLSPTTVTGHYGNPPQFSLFLPQLLVWMGIIATSKAIVLTLLILLAEPLDTALRILFATFFESFHASPKFELLMVMVFVPTISNTIYFWITDSCLKKQTNKPLYQQVLLLQDSLLPSEKEQEKLSTGVWFSLNRFRQRVAAEGIQMT